MKMKGNTGLQSARTAAGLLFFVALSPLTASAADEPLADPRGDEEIRIREVFSSHLPDTMKASTLRMSLHPHIGDLRSHDHLRLSTGVRYGLTPRWEAGLNTDFYFSHNLGDVKFFEKYGISTLQPSMKYNVGRDLLGAWDMAIGADFAFPAGRPPAELTDGLRHYGTWATFSRRLEAHPLVRIFWGFGTDFIAKTGVAGKLERNQFRESNANVNFGAVLDRGRLHYSFETSVITSRGLSSGNHDMLALRPGIIWEIPTRRDTPEKSNWVVGGALRTNIGPDGTDFGGSVKFRYNLDLKRLFGRKQP